MGEGPSAKVSQNAGTPRLQFADAMNVPGGGGFDAAVTVTLADAAPDPPAPVQVRV
jgi:hypothetical protein